MLIATALHRQVSQPSVGMHNATRRYGTLDKGLQAFGRRIRNLAHTNSADPVPAERRNLWSHAPGEKREARLQLQQISRIIFYREKHYRLRSPESSRYLSLANMYNLEFREAHHPLEDAFVTARLWQKLLTKLESMKVA